MKVLGFFENFMEDLPFWVVFRKCGEALSKWRSMKELIGNNEHLAFCCEVVNGVG